MLNNAIMHALKR